MLLFALVAAAVVAQSPAIASTEMLGIDVPDEFQVGYHQRNGETEIVELVEPPETVDNWSRLITSIMLIDGAKLGLDGAYARWREGMRSACPAMNAALIRGTVDGHAAIRGTISCPNDPQTGKPETVDAFFVEGDANLMSAQVAFRRPVSASDNALIQRIAKSLKVCDQRTMDTCSARKATGFVPSH